MHAYESVSKARGSIGHYIEFYNNHRPHSSLGVRMPDVVYFKMLLGLSAKAA